MMIDRINNIIQNLADSKLSFGDVLFKVQVLAHKLKNEKLKDWVSNELNGYEDDNKIPIYRIIQTIVKGNLMHGQMNYTNIQLSVHGIKEMYEIDLSILKIRHSVSSLESMIEKKDDLKAPLPVGLYNAISNNYDAYASVYSAWRVISHNNIVSILSSIKSNLLQFMLDIADELGEEDNIDFMKKKNLVDDLFDKNLGSGNTININTGSESIQTTIVGENHKTNIAKGENINQEISTEDLVRIKKLIDCIKVDIAKASIDSDDLVDLKNQIISIETQLQRDKPKSIILKNAFDVIKGIASGVGTHILTEPTMLQLEQIGRVFGL